MARLLPLIALGLCIYFWIKIKRNLDSPADDRSDGASATDRKDAAESASPRASKAATEAGFLPQDRQNIDRSRPDPEADAVLESIASGEWESAAQALAQTGRDWERRSALAGVLAGAASKDDAWLQAWHKARPDDPDAALLQAKSTVQLAGEIRGALQAEHTTAEQFDGFHRVLKQSREDIARAAELNPDDPSPYIAEIWAALGLGYPHEEMRKLWAEIVERAPHHYEAHYSALQYWCAKWRGSEELADGFAAQAAAGAPKGSLLTAMPLISWFEHRRSSAGRATFRTPELTAMVDAALEDVAAAREDHPRLREVRHLLAYFLTQQERYELALKQFHEVDGYIEALPWRYAGDSAAEMYCRFRERALSGARKQARKQARSRG